MMFSVPPRKWFRQNCHVPVVTLPIYQALKEQLGCPNS